MAIVPSEPIYFDSDVLTELDDLPATQRTLEYPNFSDTTQEGRVFNAYFSPTPSAPNQPSEQAKIVQKVLAAGGHLFGNLLYDVGNKLIGKFVDKSVDTAFEMAKNRGKPKAYAKVVTQTPRKGNVQPTPRQAVFVQPAVAQAPVNISKRVSVKAKPMMKGSARGIVVTHREMIGQIISSGTTLNYSATSFVINPGKVSTFPWLSTLAMNFDKYVMRRLRFYTISNQSTSVAGRVGLGYDVDSTDIGPADRNEFFSLTYHSECAPWDSVVLDVPCDRKDRFINSHTSTDSKLIDIGQVIFMSDSIVATNTALSDVIVEYVVELIDPQQAVYSTQLFAANNFSGATLDLLPVSGPVIGSPAGALSGFTYTSTATVLYIKVGQGYYKADVFVYDAEAGTPNTAIAVHGGEGRMQSGATTTLKSAASAVIKMTTNDGYVRFTFGSVAVANLEDLIVSLTRIAAPVYLLANGVYTDPITTF